jgi:Flp pilus assembly pilin Flp
MAYLKRFMQEEDGLGTVEVVMLIIVLIGVALVFKEGITELVKDLIGKIQNKMAKEL